MTAPPKPKHQRTRRPKWLPPAPTPRWPRFWPRPRAPSKPAWPLDAGANLDRREDCYPVVAPALLGVSMIRIAETEAGRDRGQTCSSRSEACSSRSEAQAGQIPQS